jgi:hypothetical protein
VPDKPRKEKVAFVRLGTQRSGGSRFDLQKLPDDDDVP